MRPAPYNWHSRVEMLTVKMHRMQWVLGITICALIFSGGVYLGLAFQGYKTEATIALCVVAGVLVWSLPVKYYAEHLSDQYTKLLEERALHIDTLTKYYG